MQNTHVSHNYAIIHFDYFKKLDIKYIHDMQLTFESHAQLHA